MCQLIDIISENINQEIDVVNKLVKKVHSIDNTIKNQYMDGLDMNIFKKEIISITHVSNNTTQEIDIFNLSKEQKKKKN